MAYMYFEKAKTNKTYLLSKLASVSRYLVRQLFSLLHRSLNILAKVKIKF